MNLEDARLLAELHMEQHGLQGWTFGFDRAVRRFGRCNLWFRSITLSRALTEANDEAEVEDTILHEIAHAIAHRLSPHDEPHGSMWRQVAARIGARPQPCYGNGVRHAMPWIGVCPICGLEHPRTRRTERLCSDCSHTLGSHFRLVWRRAEGWSP
jgi:predicted SprT family Zn-dependent metalloprotease